MSSKEATPPDPFLDFLSGSDIYNSFRDESARDPLYQKERALAERGAKRLSAPDETQKIAYELQASPAHFGLILEPEASNPSATLSFPSQERDICSEKNIDHVITFFKAANNVWKIHSFTPAVIVQKGQTQDHYNLQNWFHGERFRKTMQDSRVSAVSYYFPEINKVQMPHLNLPITDANFLYSFTKDPLTEETKESFRMDYSFATRFEPKAMELLVARHRASFSANEGDSVLLATLMADTAKEYSPKTFLS